MTGYNEVIEHANIDQCQRLLEAARERFVGRRRLGDTGRMIVRKNNSRRIMPQRPLDNFPWINAGLRQRPAKQLFRRQQTMLRVKPKRKEHFKGMPERCKRVIAHGGGLENASRSFIGSSASARRAISSTACNWVYFAAPMPGISEKAASFAANKPLRLPK